MTVAGSRLGYGFRLGLGHVLLVVVVGAVVLVLIDRGLREDLVHDLDERLEGEARGAGEWVTEGRHPDRQASRLARIAGAHVTILDGAGRVIGDSPERLPIGTDESREPEVVTALTGKTGVATRTWDGMETRFVAVRVAEERVVRLGASVRAIRTTVVRVRERLAVASGLGVLIAIGLSAFASRRAVKPLRRMRDAAQRITEGDYSVSLGGSHDEFGELERSLSVLAKRLALDRERIERLERTRRDFIADISHELRTPVTAIQGYSETLLASSTDPKTAAHFLETMHRQARRIGVLVADLLALSEMEARSPDDVKLAPVSVSDAAMQAISTVRESRADAPEIRLDAPADLRVVATSIGLEQILENLIENAARYGTARDPEGRPTGSVTVRAERAGGAVRILVEDCGAGIEPEHLPRLFERFYRVDPARSREAGGTGLGLAIVKHLVESMNGTVRVESTVGKGTTFVVELPASSGLARPSPSD